MSEDSPNDISYDAVAKRVNDVVADITAGRMTRPLRKQLGDAIDRARSGDSVVDAIGASRRKAGPAW